MSVSIANVKPVPSFHFKASFMPCAVLHISSADFEQVERELVQAITSAPNFFTGSSIIVDIEKISQVEHSLNFERLKHFMFEHHMIPIGIRGASSTQQKAAVAAGFCIMSSSKVDNAKAIAPKSLPLRESKIVTTQIRSGSQVYARECDLIVIAPVSAGAELLSDGNIHIYGPLRGRALAGVRGNVHARIFCRKLEADLVSIAGFYLTKEEMPLLSLGCGMVQIYLKNEQVYIEPIN